MKHTNERYQTPKSVRPGLAVIEGAEPSRDRLISDRPVDWEEVGGLSLEPIESSEPRKPIARR